MKCRISFTQGFTGEVTYQDGGDDEGAVSEGIGDVHPFSLRHFCDVQTSRHTPLPHLRKMKIVLLSVPFLLVCYEPRQTPPPTSLPH